MPDQILIFWKNEVKINFWGVRGSHPTPLSPEKLRQKISAVIQRVKPKDLQSPETRELFLSRLPEWLFGTIGGNTPCLEVRLSDGSCLILDAGSGIIGLSNSLSKEHQAPGSYHVFFSHFHYDHIQGLPFFMQAYNPQIQMHFYSPLEDMEYTLKDHMAHPYFPVTMQDRMTSHQYFHSLKNSPTIKIGNATISWQELNHPGKAFAYKIQEAGKTFIYATDVELGEVDFIKDGGNGPFFRDADFLVLDTMYTLGEAIDKYNWGHSSFSLGVEFAINWNVKKLALFHHEPKYDDKQIYSNLSAAKWYAQRQKSSLEIMLAEEGIGIEL